MNHINESLTRNYFNVGSRTHGRDTFYCVASHMDVANAENAKPIGHKEQFSAQEKYSKEIRPMPLVSCALAVLWGLI
jgi:hypothetical protein